MFDLEAARGVDGFDFLEHLEQLITCMGFDVFDHSEMQMLTDGNDERNFVDEKISAASDICLLADKI